MKYINLIIAALMGISFSLAAPTLAEDITQGLGGNYTMVDIQWEVPISADRTDTVTGTIEDVMRHLEVVAPEMLEAHDVSIPDLEPTSVPVPFDGPVVRTPDPASVECNWQRFARANDKQIAQGIYHLNHVSGKPTNGGHSCGQVSCSWKSAILWCNDSNDDITLDSFSMIADGAQAILDHCEVGFGGELNGRTVYDDGWSVIVTSSSADHC